MLQNILPEKLRLLDGLRIVDPNILANLNTTPFTQLAHNKQGNRTTTRRCIVRLAYVD